jgi:hypothetical protein
MPGLDRNMVGHTMVYTADGKGLATVPDEEAEGLVELLDPHLQAPPRSNGPYGPYLCPACRNKTLWLALRGNWD